MLLTNPDTPASGSGFIGLSIPLDIGGPTGTYGALFGVGDVYLDDVGVGEPGEASFYQISPTTYTDGTKLSVGTTVGAGLTWPDGVPYPALLVAAGTTYCSIVVPGVADPDAATNQYRARPTWPDTYMSGDVLFSGTWQVALVDE